MVFSIEVILPCLDEAESLPGVLAELPTGFQPLVVDNGSTDGTPGIAREHGVPVVHEPRKGYGAAVHSGLEQARTELVAVLDADGSLDPGVLPELAEAVECGRADLAVGRRIPVRRGVQPWHARAGNALLAALLRRRGAPVHDIAPIRVARRKALLELGVVDRGFGYPLELLSKAAEAGWRIHETTVDYRPRTGGRSKVSGSVTGTVRAVRDMAKVMRG
ncbi:glycosyltransferase family 2 protein [Sciscionella marina]|uniref:glycosyltransferase family 2 protein n=1 Tax=Sciscionella marina TaxID=508770 RepID=UPI00036C2D13|nr:glycosyltransferase family 2 protein [Sciscionella marina]